MTGVHNEWAEGGGGYRFNDGLGDVQLNAFYEGYAYAGLRVILAQTHRPLSGIASHCFRSVQALRHGIA